MKRLAVSAALLLALLGETTITHAADPAEPPLRLGYSQTSFKGYNQTDALAAMRAWGQTIARDRGLLVDSEMVIFDHLDSAASAVRQQRLDGVTLSILEFTAFPPGLLRGPFLRDEQNGSTHAVYALVAATDGPVRQVRDVQNARVVVHDGEYSDVGLTWLEAQLAMAGLGRLQETAARVTLNAKASPSVLNVFFGQADACLVRRQVFEAAVELNPQVGARLTVVAESAPVIPSLFAFRTEVPEHSSERLFREVLRLHETKMGEQVLTMFKADRMAEVTPQDVDRSMRLVNDWLQAAGGSR